MIQSKFDVTERRPRTDNARRGDGLDRGHAVLGGGAPGGESQEAEKGQGGPRDAAERVQGWIV